MKKKRISLLLCGILMAGIFTGCGNQNPSEQDSYISRVAQGLSPDTVMLTVNGKEIDAEHYLYWLGNSIDYLEYYYFTDGLDWESDAFEGTSVEDYLVEDAVQAITQYQVIEDKAKELGCALDGDDQKELEAMRDSYVEYFGGEEAYEQQLQSEGLTQELFDELNAVPLLYNNLYEHLMSEGGTWAPSDEDFDKFLNDNQYVYAKHILISTVDEEGNALPDEEKEKKRQEAEAILAQVQASDDLESSFDALMKERSEDTGLAYYPDGYVFKAGEMVEPFENAAFALEPGSVSDVVESSFGYHVILRLPMDTETAKADEELYSAFQSEAFGALLEGWWGEAEVTRSDALSQVDVKAFYEKRAQIREEAQALLEQQNGDAEKEVENTDGGDEPGENQEPGEEPVGQGAA